MERTVTMHGNPLTLAGTALKVGDKAPDFKVVDNSLAGPDFLPIKAG